MNRIIRVGKDLQDLVQMKSPPAGPALCWVIRLSFQASPVAEVGHGSVPAWRGMHRSPSEGHPSRESCHRAQTLNTTAFEMNPNPCAEEWKPNKKGKAPVGDQNPVPSSPTSTEGEVSGPEKRPPQLDEATKGMRNTNCPPR